MDNMKTISNQDHALLLRIARAYTTTKAVTTKEQDLQRRARQITKKYALQNRKNE
jgi:hypothetical protein